MIKRTIVIVGGGFSGAMTAIHALRQARLPLTIEIIEPRQELGAGLAYSTRHREHRLNVPARRMVLFEEHPTHFHDWFTSRGLDRADPGCDAGGGNLFAARNVFARYMRELLNDAVTTAHPGCSLVHRHACAADIEPRSGGGWRLVMTDGSVTLADDVVVCIGHSSTLAPAPFDRPALTATGKILNDPWDATAIAALGADARLLVLGQGLTMGDVIATLQAQAHRGPVVAVSRRGLLARAYADSVKTRVPFDSLADDATASAVLRLMRDACAEAVRTGNSWNAVIETTREEGARLWRRLSVVEQCRLIRHARVFWDAHRYRMAPQVAGAIERARDEGRLRLVAGRVVDAEAIGNGFHVTVRLRRDRGEPWLRQQFDAVVNCVGPTHDVARLTNPLIQALLRRRLARAHATRLGFEVGSNNALLGDGGAAAGLHVVGPLSRGACGDIVGAPEISRQARAVVDGLLEDIRAGGRPMDDGDAAVSTVAA